MTAALVQIVDITNTAGRVAGSYSLENTAAPYADSCFYRSHAWDTKQRRKRKREERRVGRDSPAGSDRWGRDTARGSKARARGRGKSTDRTGATTMREKRSGNKSSDASHHKNISAFRCPSTNVGAPLGQATGQAPASLQSWLPHIPLSPPSFPHRRPACTLVLL